MDTIVLDLSLSGKLNCSFTSEMELTIETLLMCINAAEDREYNFYKFSKESCKIGNVEQGTCEFERDAFDGYIEAGRSGCFSGESCLKQQNGTILRFSTSSWISDFWTS